MSQEHNVPKGEVKAATERQIVVHDDLHPGAAERLAATLDLERRDLQAGTRLPLGWHWLYFLEAPPTSAVGFDGRTVADGFLPDTGLPRRMWAGGELTCHRPLVLGQPTACEARIESVQEKHGGTGRLIFLDLRYRLSGAEGLAVEEQRDIVMREAPAPGETPRRREPPGEALWRRDMIPSHLLLFRFSALTFNGHRIHYDADYVRDVEGYPGLVVHGPLLALLLLDLLEKFVPGADVRRFRYRAVAPLFVDCPLALCGRPRQDGGAELWVEGDDGRLATWAEADFF